MELFPFLKSVFSPSSGYILPKKDRINGISNRVVLCCDKSAYISEQYRSAAARLKYLAKDKESFAVIVTSAIPGEGKSTTAANLAVALAESTTDPVILIDGDLRKPTIHKLFGLNIENGLLQVINNPTVPVEPEKVAGLNILTAGTSGEKQIDPTKLSCTRELILDLKKHYKYVIVDCPPVQSVADTQIIGQSCDGALFVVRARSTSSKLVKSSIELLRGSGVTPIGTLLTRSISEVDMYSYWTNKDYRRYFEKKYA